nr:adenylate/guanylate cyclase domain-containing protein [Roseomonas acroporae]
MPPLLHSPPAGPEGPPRHCGACGTAAQPGARFCGACGHALPTGCPSCGTLAANAAQRFCTACGTRLHEEAAPAPPAMAERTAERRLLTALFCDLVGSTDLSSRLDPEDLAALLLSYRELCAAAVVRHGGYVQHYAGDGIMACFGFPRALGRDAQAAVACGLEIARAMAELGRNVAGLDAAAPATEALLTVRIGIETGVVVAGRLGRPGVAMEIDAMVGGAPNMAARLQEIAPRNGVVIGGTVYDLVAADFLCEPAETARLRLPQPARAFVVTGARAAGSRLLAARRRAPLVNRVTEMALLAERWARAREGRGQVVLLSGEPGIGKSRLVRELLDRAAAADDPAARPQVVELTCAPQTASTALYPVIEALRGALEAAGPKAGPRDDMARLAALTEAAGLPREPALAVLAEALGFGPGPADLAPHSRRLLLMQSLQAWLLHHAARQPLLLLAEDLHWADPSTVELLRGIGDAASAHRAMLLATYRSEFVLSWPDRATVLRIALPPLGRAEASRLVDLLSGGQAMAREAILSRADGVPLFIEEFVLATGEAAVPHTLQQLFAARLDSLGEARLVAQLAAVLGREIERDLLEALCRLPPPVLDEHLARLVEAEMLEATALLPVPTYTFRHAVLQRAAYESLLHADRRAYHARAAALLATLRPALLQRQPELIAEHHEAGGEPALAVPLLARAARASLAAFAVTEAETQARRGLDLAAQLPAEAMAEAVLGLLITLGQALIARKGYASSAVLEVFERASRMAGEVEDDTRILPLLRGLASFYQVRGPVAQAEAVCARLVAATERAGDPVALPDAWRRQAWNRQCAGRLAEAEAGFARVLAALDASAGPDDLARHVAIGGNDPRAVGLANLCWLDLWRHGPEAGARRAREAAAAGRASPHPVSACYALVFAALPLQEAGHWDEALALAEAACRIADGKDIRYWIAMSRVMIGRHQVARGDRAAAAAGLAAIAEGHERYRETQGEILRPCILGLLGEAHAALGEVEAAYRVLTEAVALAAEVGAEGFLPDLLLRQSRLPGLGTAARMAALERALRLARTQEAWAIARSARAEMER